MIGECELDALGDRSLFYRTERSEWSKQLTIALELLNDIANAAPELDGVPFQSSRRSHHACGSALNLREHAPMGLNQKRLDAIKMSVVVLLSFHVQIVVSVG